MVCGKNAEVFGMISNKYARLVVLQELPTLVEKLWHYRMQSAGIYILIDEKVLNVSKILGPRRKKLYNVQLCIDSYVRVSYVSQICHLYDINIPL